MTVDDVFDDRKPQSRAATFTAGGCIDAIKSLGQSRQMFSGDPLTKIADG